jgi:hypothetical protein
MFSLLGLLCIIVGFILAVVEGNFLFPPLHWFVAAIAFNTLETLPIPWGRRDNAA